MPHRVELGEAADVDQAVVVPAYEVTPDAEVERLSGLLALLGLAA